MNNIQVKYYIAQGMEHNWKVYTNGLLLGYVHCNGDGEDFGGSLYTSDVNHIEDQETWDRIQEACIDQLADFYLIDRMKTMGY